MLAIQETETPGTFSCSVNAPINDAFVPRPGTFIRALIWLRRGEKWRLRVRASNAELAGGIPGNAQRTNQQDIQVMTMPPSIGTIHPCTDQTVGLDDRFFREVNHELADRGFLTTSAESLVTWARTGFADVDDLRARLLRDRNDADVDAAL